MSRYTTTRGGPDVDLEVALFEGLAPDGGLYMPDEPPRLDWPPPVSSTDDDLRPVADWAAPSFFPSVVEACLSDVVREAFDFPVPLISLDDGVWALELFHGPTHAFKDVGARFMASLMSRLDASTDRRTILVATSGDTGGAVASAFHGIDRYDVVALFPRRGISARQRRQMTTLGGNVHAVAVDGTFDDCQRLVKGAFADRHLRARHGLTSANSINVARLLPQAFYYFHAALALSAITREAPVFVVPSGNLGNLCAGLVAARAGMPTRGFVAASNRNRGFVDFLRGADFSARPSIQTTSSAMDVGDPSNLERIFWLNECDPDAMRREVRGESVADAEVAQSIGDLYESTGYVADPHTAVAYCAAKRRDRAGSGPRIVLATAHPAKFPDVVQSVIGRELPVPPGLLATRGSKEMMHDLPPRLSSVRELLTKIGS